MKKATRYNKLSLNKLTSAVEGNKKLDISNNDNMEASKITIIKRNGSKEPFMPDKLKRVCMWATGELEAFADELIRDTEIKLHKEIKIQDMYNQLIITAVNKISMLYPIWEDIAARLELVKIYKETAGISHSDEYPHLKDTLQKGIQHKIYDRKTVSLYSTEEIEQLNNAIKPERDLLFNYKGIVVFNDKYCLNYSKTKKLELPQHAYMRVAIALNVDEKDRVTRTIETYDALSSHDYTAATPIMMNTLTPGQQLSSCVLNTVGDDSHSILDTGKNLGIYSKFKGGTALDISSLRAKGSYIEGAQGYSSGPVPFMKYYESIMKGWNQGGKRPGSCAVYFDWWHLNVYDILSLKSNGGTEENRARGLQYAIKFHQYFLDAVIADEDIHLFDPKDVEDLVGKVGDEFNTLYDSYKEKNIKKKVIKARELWYFILKMRSETGNIYMMHYENANNTLLNRYIGSSNLCTEILLPSRESKPLSEEIVTFQSTGKTKIVKEYTAGEIALCNLSSVNLARWIEMDDAQKDKLIRTVVRTLDNTIDLAFYPVMEGEYSNKLYRYLGIGVLNYTNYLALNGIVIDTQEAHEETAKLFDDLSYRLISASCDLAIEKGKFPRFHETQWAEGILPIHKANKKALALTEYQPDMDKWDALSERIKIHGIRNAQIMAIAPTATSGRAINATESTEPIPELFYKDEGTITIPTLAPNFRKNNKYYKKAFECNQFALMRNAAIRQIYIDQAQSVNMYISRPDSFKEMTLLHLYYFDLGGKTLYYLKQQKDTEEEICESCT